MKIKNKLPGNCLQFLKIMCAARPFKEYVLQVINLTTYKSLGAK